MRSSAFVYLRATCHLFPSQLPELKTLAKAPAVWSCGDLHLENFGSYKGDNRLSYFDINDFDESALIPASWDLVRLLTSVRPACAELEFKDDRVRELIDVLLAAYFKQLQHGSARWLERDTATGPVQELLATVSDRKREDFLDSRSTKRGKKRKLLIDGKKALAASKEQHKQISEFMEKFAKTQNEPEFYEVLDVARRAQAVPVAFLHAVQMNENNYVLSDLQPSADRVSFLEKGNDERRLNELMLAIGRCTAWSHLRGSGRQGSAIADRLVAFGSDDSWLKVLRKASTTCADNINVEWKTYSEAYDNKVFD